MTRWLAREHDGWLGEPFASDFGAAWGVILREDIYDGSGHRTLGSAAKAAKVAGLRYLSFTPVRMINLGRKVWTNCGAERKLYVRKGTSCLEIYFYLHWRENSN